MENDLKSLVLTSEKNFLSEIFLFQVLRYYTSNGLRVVYIAPEPISNLPPSVQDNEVLNDPEIMRLVSFHYISRKTELLEYLSTLNKAHKPPSTIIIQNMEVYCDSPSAGLVCAIAINAASMCSSNSGSSCNLVVSFKSPIPPILIHSFFHNVWCVLDRESDTVVISNLNPKPDQPSKFHLSFEDNFSRLVITKAFRVVQKKSFIKNGSDSW